MFEIRVESRFVAQHQLTLPEVGTEPLHEHDWGVRVTVVGEHLDDNGLLVDFGLLRRRIANVLQALDGRNLNALPTFAERSPSAENVALHVAGQLADELPRAVRLAHVEVEEEPGCVARYFPSIKDGPTEQPHSD